MQEMPNTAREPTPEETKKFKEMLSRALMGHLRKNPDFKARYMPELSPSGRLMLRSDESENGIETSASPSYFVDGNVLARLARKIWKDLDVPTD